MPAADIRPMSIGELLDRTFTFYRQNFLVFVGIMVVPQLFILLFNILQGALTMMGSTVVAPGAGGTNPGAGLPNMSLMLGTAVLSIVALFVQFAMYAIAQAATVFAVADLYLGKPATARDSYRRVQGKFMRVADVLISSSIRIMLGLFLFIIPGILLLLRYCVAVPAAMLEDLKAGPALKRSTALTEGRRSDAFLIFLLSVILSWVASLIFAWPFVFLQQALLRSGQDLSWVSTLSYFGAFAGGVLVGPIATIALALFYYDCRVRKEALDLQVMLSALDTQGPSPATP